MIDHNAHSGLDPRRSRRELLVSGLTGLAGLGVAGLLLGGCSSGGRGAGDLPETQWPDAGQSRGTMAKRWEPLPDQPSAGPMAPDPGVIGRAEWAKGAAVPSLMDRADRPYTRITLHHDGMPDPFFSTDRWAAAARIERIRSAHRARNFGDVGYHFLIDPAGRVWEGRPLSWQGAHVAKQNPGNMGICVMGNYMLQRPSQTQLASVEQFVGSQMRRCRMRLSEIKTHQELASTECPGRNLQPALVSMRNPRGSLGRMA